ncbi:GTP-binding protein BRASSINAZOLE INSENSITIVE PALE GREEN 2, chloroplastic [Sarracenia purpurea var. burkii]
MAALLSAAILPLATIKLTLKIPKISFEGKSLSTLPLFTGLGEENNGKHRKKVLLVRLSVNGSESTIQTTSKNPGKSYRKGDRKLILSEGRDEDENYGLICHGCGVFMQDKDPNLPGYYQKRMVEVKQLLEDEENDFEEFVEEEEEEEEEEAGILDEIDGKYEESDDEEANLKTEDGIGWDMEEWESEFEDEDNDLKESDGFSPAGVGYGNITEEIVNKQKKKKVSKAERKRLAREAQREKEEDTVCARCHSLRNYGQVKNQAAENLIPDFDFDRLITTRLMKPTGNANATVVVMVVDCVDFDGSFPRRAAKSLFKALEGIKDGPKLSKKLPKLVLVATKVDLLPSQISPTRLDRWVRHRAKAGGAPKLSGVYLVSARKDLGVRNVLSFIKELAGPRGNVWVIGAQNAGKSTLINALAKKEGVKVTKLTEAAVPGTTLGILRIGGILSAKAKMYDTPGLLHPYSMSVRLNRDEQKMVEIRKELQPRTYRMKPGQVVHVGALMRLDLTQASVATIYVTIWASPNVSLHMGKMENADEILIKHGGVRLQPPIGEERVSEMGTWVKKEIKVSGTSWDVNSIDIAAAGLGWFSLGLKGEATVILWIYDGVEVTLREPLALDRASFLERPGFWLPKAISDAIGNQTNKIEAENRKKLQEESTMSLSDVSV